DLFVNRLDPRAHPAFATLGAARVSAHFVIRRDGELLQFVQCSLRAWHAGASSWRGRARCNYFSIGVELEGTDDLPYTEAQYAGLARLTRALRRRYPIADLAGHDEIAPGRKTDPGASFDWARYRRLVAPRNGSRHS
ncbi:MAG: 1,6-anhydro-N-acetylmuramyl-L-alanine amidase AmpD, partial [Casimicrobiaceae bacterium]